MERLKRMLALLWSLAWPVSLLFLWLVIRDPGPPPIPKPPQFPPQRLETAAGDTGFILHDPPILHKNGIPMTVWPCPVVIYIDGWGNMACELQFVTAASATTEATTAACTPATPSRRRRPRRSPTRH